MTGWLVIALGLLPPAGRWAGYQEVQGSREVPLLGRVKTGSRTWFVAELVPSPTGYALQQRPCAVHFTPVLGVEVVMPPRALAALPPSSGTLSDEGGGQAAGTWVTGWGEADLDRDGHPGISLEIKAPLCGGRLQVASEATTRARARYADGVIEGRVIIDVKQRILGASGACLRQVAQDEVEQVQGWFRLVPVPPDTECPTDLTAWPALPPIRQP